MARRKKSSAEGSLDSLLDTLTNVVGILVIMLVVLQLGVGSAVKAINDNHSEEEVKASEEELKLINKNLNQFDLEIEKSENENPFIKIDIEKQRKLLEEMKQKLALIDKSVTNPEELKKQIEERKKQIKKMEDGIKKEENDISNLKALMASTPVRGPDPEAKIVNLPNPQGAPKGAIAENFLCYKGRIYYVNTSALQNKTIEKFNKMKKFIIQKDGFLDCARIKEEFEKSTIQYGGLNAKIAFYKTRKDPYIVVAPNVEKGDDIDRIKVGKSFYRQALRKMNPRRQWIRFYVWSDSFDIYLDARNYAAKKGFAAGWVPYTPTQSYTMTIKFPAEIKKNIVCAGYEAPPKRAPQPKDPNKPTLLKDDID